VARRQTRRVALLSIHPRFARAILEGSKTVELRRARLPEDVSHVVVYATSPVQRIVGWFEVSRVERDLPSRLWRRHGTATGVSRDEFHAYFAGANEGTAISVGRVAALDKPLHLRALGHAVPPQSYRYLDEARAGHVFDKTCAEG
jgi:predicted transcriptional regulator